MYILWQFYIINAAEIAHQVGLGNRINTIMETVFMKLTGAIDFDKAISQLKSQITKAYMHEGGEVVAANLQAIDRAIGALVKVEIPDSWADVHNSAALDSAESVEVRATSFLSPLPAGDSPLEKFVREISAPCLQLRGDTLPVSLFKADGRMPMGTTAFERRRIAYRVPQWDPDKCVERTASSATSAHMYALTPPYVRSCSPTLSCMKRLPGLLHALLRRQNSKDCTSAYRPIPRIAPAAAHAPRYAPAMR